MSFDVTPLPQLRLHDPRVIVAGDWHGNLDWIRRALTAAGRHGRTVLQLGDFGFFPTRHPDFLEHVDAAAADAGIDRILVTPGNHEEWSVLDALFREHPGKALRLSRTVTVLPPGYRFQIGGRFFTSLGGAPSIDFEHRTPGETWWPEEMITDADAERAIQAGWADVMLTHETINGSRLGAVEHMLTSPSSWSDRARARADRGRELVTYAWQAIAPQILFHGHYHVHGTGHLPGGRRVVALDRDGAATGNLALLEVDTLRVESVPVLSRVPAAL